MKEKKILFALMGFSLFAFGIGYVLLEPIKFGICQSTYYSPYGYMEGGQVAWCNESFGENVFEALLLAFVPLFLITFILFFVRREVFLVWARFAGIAFPFVLGILLYTYNNRPTEGGFGLAGLISDEMLASVFLPPFFFLISLLIIGIKSWKLRRR